MSVGLPASCTPDDIVGRYLDLVGLLPTPDGRPYEPPAADLDALSAATSWDRDRVAGRVAALQSERAAGRSSAS